MWCVLAQISEMDRHKSQVIIFFYRKTRTKMWSVLAQITVNILQFLSIEGQRQITKMC